MIKTKLNFSTKGSCEENTFNLFQGIKVVGDAVATNAIPELDGSDNNESLLKTVLDHVKVLVNHTQTEYDFFLNCLAFLFQKQFREKLKVCLVFISTEGTGKSLFFRGLLSRMVGLHNFYHAKTFSGFFKEVEKGSCKVLIYIDEPSVILKQQVEMFKTYIDCLSKDQKISKLSNSYTMEDYSNYIITSNPAEFPANLIKQESRRYFITKVSEEHVGNKEHFVHLSHVLETHSETPIVFYRFLLERNIDGFIPEFEIPVTMAKTELLGETTSPPIIFFQTCIQQAIEGTFGKCPGFATGDWTITTEKFRDLFGAYCA